MALVAPLEATRLPRVAKRTPASGGPLPFPSGRDERGRGVRQDGTRSQRRRAAAPKSPEGICPPAGQESAQAADDKGFEIGRRDPLTSGTVRRGASDEAAGDVVAVPRSLLDRVGRRHEFGTGVEDNAGQQAWFEGFAAFPPLHPVLFEMALHPSHRSSSTIAACSSGNALPLWTISPR